MKTIYLLYETEGDYDSYQETVLEAFLSERKATARRIELEAVRDAHNAVANACRDDIRRWIDNNPRPAHNIYPDPAVRAWYEAYNAAVAALNPDRLYAKDHEYKVEETELDDEE